MIPSLNVLRGMNPLLVYILPLILGIGLYLTPIFMYFELYNRDILLEKFGFVPEVPNEQVYLQAKIVLATILLMDVIALVVLTRMKKNK